MAKMLLTPAEVEHLERLLGGDNHVEDMVLRFIFEKYGARNLSYIPRNVAEQIFKRPAGFLRAVKNHCELDVKF